MMLRNCSGVCSRDWAVTVAFSCLARHGGLGADLAGRDLDVLRLDGGVDVRRLQLEIVQLVGVEPDAHGVLRAEHLGVADAGARGSADPASWTDDEVARCRRWCSGRCRHRAPTTRMKLACALATITPCCCTGWAAAARPLHLVLHLHLGDVGIGARREGGGDRHRAVGIGLVDEKYSRLSRPVSCCSITWVTEFCKRLGVGAGIGGGDRPPRAARWSGYCSTGRLRTAMPPASMITMAMTQAKTGRSMKKRDSD